MRRAEEATKKSAALGGGYGGVLGPRGPMRGGAHADRAARPSGGEIQAAVGRVRLTRRVIRGGYAAGAFHGRGGIHR